MTTLDPPQVQVTPAAGRRLIQWAMDGDINYYVSVNGVPRKIRDRTRDAVVAQRNPADITVTAFTWHPRRRGDVHHERDLPVTPGTSPPCRV